MDAGFRGRLIAVAIAAIAVVGPAATIRNAFGVRLVDRYIGPPPTATVPRPRVLQDGRSRYGYLIMTGIPTNKQRRYIESTALVVFLGVEEVGETDVVYRVRYYGGLNDTRDALARASSHFYNLVAIEWEDKVSRKIGVGSGFSAGEYDPNDGGIYAAVLFFKDVPVSVRDSLVSLFADSVLYATRMGFVIKSDVRSLAELGAFDEVEYVAERDIRPQPVMTVSRGILGVDLLQKFDTSSTQFPPSDTAYWIPDTSLTGEGIHVGIYDYTVDSTVLDFREWDHNRAYSPFLPDSQLVDSTILRRITGGAWGYPASDPHGTLVASIVGGNGWQSSSEGYPKYAWRGVAPRAQFLSRSFIWDGDDGDVNNHSHTTGTGGYYTGWDGDVDEALSPHDATTNIIVYAAANNGWGQNNSSNQRGYFSLLVNAKNCVTVGAVEKYTGIRSPFSSMGPTRDGRLKPDVMAPGSGWQTAYHVEVDSVAIINNGVKKAWDFQPDDPAWIGYGTIRGLCRGGTDTLRFTFGSENDLVGPYINPPGLLDQGDTVITSTTDSLVFKWRIQKDTADAPADTLHVWISWNGSTPGGGTYTDRAKGFHHVVSGTWEKTAVPIHTMGEVGTLDSSYVNGDTLTGLLFHFCTTDDRGLGTISANNASTGGYLGSNGTSMAAPHATGVVALTWIPTRPFLEFDRPPIFRTSPMNPLKPQPC